MGDCRASIFGDIKKEMSRQGPGQLTVGWPYLSSGIVPDDLSMSTILWFHDSVWKGIIAYFFYIIF